jgi:hypothetical protein
MMVPQHSIKTAKTSRVFAFTRLDFETDAHSNLFATSHGKSPCDGIGGTVKRLVAGASWQATLQDQILTPQQMYN